MDRYEIKEASCCALMAHQLQSVRPVEGWVMGLLWGNIVTNKKSRRLSSRYSKQLENAPYRSSGAVYEMAELRIYTARVIASYWCRSARCNYRMAPLPQPKGRVHFRRRGSAQRKTGGACNGVQNGCRFTRALSQLAKQRGLQGNKKASVSVRSLLSNFSLVFPHRPGPI